MSNQSCEKLNNKINKKYPNKSLYTSKPEDKPVCQAWRSCEYKNQMIQCDNEKNLNKMCGKPKCRN